MRELFEVLPHKGIYDLSNNQVLLDTCFFIHTFQNKNEKKLRELMISWNVAMTSFNVQEFLFKEHSIDERVREYARKFLKRYPITIIDVNVTPGELDKERSFIFDTDPELLNDVKDMSDGVLIATAIRTRSIVLTKDKHHLFTVKLEEYLKKYGISVYKEFHELLSIN
ncbi:MAG: hypothetical protein KatS3mg002_1142 [Candidatus Woesearchaeota archaeon]|nr:MAG: hypothetical protein KatS3mg002_1142 [Candidatus Woesearchaeota archaeon]